MAKVLTTGNSTIMSARIAVITNNVIQSFQKPNAGGDGLAAGEVAADELLITNSVCDR